MSSFCMGAARIALVVGMMISVARPTAAEESCGLLPHGDFSEGLTGWTVEVSDPSATGDATAYANAFLFDGSTYGDPPLFDANTLVLFAQAFSGLNSAPGAASIEIIASTPVTVSDRFLRMRRGGGFEFQFQGLVGRELQVWFEATTTDGRVARRTLYSSVAEAAEGCDLGLSVLGTFDAPDQRVQVDLAAAGILPGELAMVRVGIRVAAETLEPCQFLINEAFLIVDRFETCDERLFRGDLNCDGSVDFFDIDPFIQALFDPAGYAAMWVNCDILNGDVNDDQLVNFFDIDPFVGCLFGECP